MVGVDVGDIPILSITILSITSLSITSLSSQDNFAGLVCNRLGAQPLCHETQISGAAYHVERGWFRP